jgi:hypothetical protein
LPAKNDDAQYLKNRGAFFAGKSDRRTARSYRGGKPIPHNPGTIRPPHFYDTKEPPCPGLNCLLPPSA